MSPRHSFFLPLFVSIATAAVYHPRGNANVTGMFGDSASSFAASYSVVLTTPSAPYSNVTALTTSSSNVISTSAVSSTASSLAQVNVVAPSNDGTTQPTAVDSPGLPGSNQDRNATSVASSPIVTPAMSVVNVTYLVSTLAQNSTAPSTLSPSALWSNVSSSTTRRSNASCTVHIPDASMDWWLPATYSHKIATMTSTVGNFSNKQSYTLIPNPTTFDVASAITSDFACTLSESYISSYDFTATYCEAYTDIPTAASTAVATRTAAAPFPPEGSIAISDARFYDLYADGLPVATKVVSIAPNKTFVESSATPYVRFIAYEIESANSTRTVQLPSAQVYPYYVKGIEQKAMATGAVPEDFLAQVPQSGCDAGELKAVVTVVVVVNLVYENNPMWDPFLVHIESSVIGFDDDPSVIILNEGSTRGVPLTMDDWDLGGTARPATTTADARANNRPDPVPTTQPGGNSNPAASNGGSGPNPPSPTQVTIGNVGTIPVVVQGPSSQVVVGSVTLRPDEPPQLVGGVTPVQIVGTNGAPTAIVVAGSTSQLPQIFSPSRTDTPALPPLITLGGETLTPNAATQFFLGPSQILTPGGTATFDGTVVSLAPQASFIVVGSSTQFLAPAAGPAPSSPAQIVVGSSTITAVPASGSSPNPGNQNGAAPGPSFVIDGQTLAPGGQAITVSGTTISLQQGGSSVVVNGMTSAVINPAGVPQAAQPTIRVGESTFTAQPGSPGSSGNSFVIGDQTLAPGGQAITVSGTTLSLGPSASFVVVNGQTSQLANPAAAQITAAPVLTIGNGVFRPLPGTGTSYLIGSSILTPGGSVVVADTTISLAPGATALIINGKTSSITPPVVTNAPLLTIGSQTYTAVSGTTFVISGQTLTPGGVITVDGTTIRLSPGATELVYGSAGTSTTTALFPATTTRAPSVTSAASPSAGASGRNGQANPTQSRQGAANALYSKSSGLMSVVFALSSIFVLNMFVF